MAFSDAPQCGAQTRQGTPCKNPATQTGRCRMHGGTAPTGIASPYYKHGLRSKYLLPPRMRKNYEAALEAPDLLALHHEIAVLDARLAELVARVDSGESGRVWQELYDTRMALLAARKVGDSDRQIVALNAILELIAQGHADYRAWHEIGQTIEQRRRLVESETKRIAQTYQTVTMEQAMGLMVALLESVKRHIDDHEKLVAIQTTFDRITAGHRAPGIIDAESAGK